MKEASSTETQRHGEQLREAILLKLQHHDRVTSSELHHRLGGRYSVMDIEAELIAMDLDGVVINDLVPQSRITQKGRNARAKTALGFCVWCGEPFGDTHFEGCPKKLAEQAGLTRA